MNFKLSDFKGLAFDLDDTLIDRKSAYTKFIFILYNTFDIFKVISKDEAIDYFWSLSPNNHFNIRKALERIKKDFKNFNLNYEEFYEFYYKNMAELVTPYEGVGGFLDKLIKKNIRLGIVTNGGKHQFEKIKNTGLENKYDFVIASELFGYEKPNIKIFEETLSLLNLSKKEVENVLFIGDNPYTDIIGAQTIGFQTVWISMGREYPNELKAPNYIVDNFNELEI